MEDFAHKGNEKIGKAVIFNREVGASCPSDCYFLNNGCYAQFTELRFPAAKHVGERNMNVKRDTLVKAIQYAIKNTKGRIRIHERGDFVRKDKLDTSYVKLWESVLNEFKPTGVWVYTHFYHPRIAQLSKYGVSVYASVHNVKQLQAAKKAGFTLFAYISKQVKKKGGSHDAPKYLTFNGKRFLVCPEQRLGRNRVTCCGTKNTTACMYCVTGKGNVVFLEH